MNPSFPAFWDALSAGVFVFPLAVAWFWILGALVFFNRWERPDGKDPTTVAQNPPVSLLIPCFNEADNVRETVEWALASDYPQLEVLALNDGSSDATADILNELAPLHPRLRVVHLKENQGKAMCLRAGAMLAQYDILVCIDGDALIDPAAVGHLARRFARDQMLGAVTGNPRIRNRSTVLSKVQVGEFATISLMKRAESTFGVLMSLSGVIAAFRREALASVGYWSADALTEDIDVTWKLQRAGWRVAFEPKALVWTLMPETLKGLWRQRFRWAKGGAEVLFRNVDVLWRPSQLRLWPLMVMMVSSMVWLYALAAVFVGGLLSRLGAVGGHVAAVGHAGLAPAVLALTGLGQLALARWLDRRYEPEADGVFFWLVWYPFAYWLINSAAAFAAFPSVATSPRTRARWVSPDRGVKVP